jgi:F0F1-type ATP synthase assembly protein I
MTAVVDHHRERGRRLVLRYALVQLAAAGVVAAVALAVAGFAAARAGLAGGFVVALGNVVFGWTLFRPGIAPVPVLARAAYAGEVLKWLWVGAALWVALGVAHLPPLPFVAGLVAAQIGFWVGIAVIRG